MTFHDPATYDGRTLCPRCGQGWPCCADRDEHGQRYSHELTCNIYNYSDTHACGRCTLELALTDA